jgi:hypothetical protein
MRVALFGVLGAACAVAQGSRWGFEASGSYLTIPKSIIEKIPDSSYRDTLKADGYTYTGRLCRFHENGAPSYSFGYVHARLDLSGYDAPSYSNLSGRVTLRGAAITKFVNFFSRSGGSLGLFVGGGIAQGNAWAVETSQRANLPPYYNRDELKNKPLPLFEFGGQGDIRIGRRFSVYMLGGFQYLGLGGGAGVRYRFGG